MGKSGNTGIRRIARATVYSIQGFSHAWRYEAAFRQEIALTVLLVPLAFWLGRSVMETTLLIASCLLVLIVELLNSAVEAVVDRFGKEIHVASGRAKDLGSAAVFLSLVFLGLVWGGVAWSRFLA